MYACVAVGGLRLHMRKGETRGYQLMNRKCKWIGEGYITTCRRINQQTDVVSYSFASVRMEDILLYKHPLRIYLYNIILYLHN